jgi:DNA-binding MarR family transcriptional regulator
MILVSRMVYEKFMIVAKLMTDATMRSMLDDMRKGSACEPGSMVLLSRLAKQFYRRGDEQLLGMQLRHLVALAYVRDHNGCPQQELAEAFCMDANNVVLLLNELEDLDFARRVRDPHDRRRHLVEITATGRTALGRTEPAQSALEDEVLQALEPDERATLRALLMRALRSVEPAHDDAYSVTTASIST